MRKPKDKASVEDTVSHLATWVIAGLRDRQFTSLPDALEALRSERRRPTRLYPGVVETLTILKNAGFQVVA